MPSDPSTSDNSQPIHNDPVLERRIQFARRRLRTSTTYLGDDYTTTQKKLTWRVTDLGNILVEKSVLFPGGRSPQRGDDESPEDPLLPAKLSVIVMITHEDFWLSSDGGWDGSTKNAPTLADVKLTFTGGSPGQDDLAGDFVTAIDNIDNFIVRARHRTYAIDNFRVLSSLTLQPKIQLRHLLFAKRMGFMNPYDDAFSDYDDAEDVATARGRPNKLKVADFNIANWPVHSIPASSAIRSLRSTHKVSPLKAFDIDNKLIHPLDYRSKLRGALAEVVFTMTHWPEPGRNGKCPMDTFVADVVRIRILETPISLGRVVSKLEDPDNIASTSITREERETEMEMDNDVAT